jgi:hypothetical protein
VTVSGGQVVNNQNFGNRTQQNQCDLKIKKEVKPNPVVSGQQANVSSNGDWTLTFPIPTSYAPGAYRAAPEWILARFQEWGRAANLRDERLRADPLSPGVASRFNERCGQTTSMTRVNRIGS